MKKATLILGLIACISLGSCKKDWTCTCVNQGGGKTYHTIPDATLNDAKKTCDGFEYQIGGVYTNCDI